MASAVATTTKKMITLKSSDGEEFEVEEAVAMESQPIRHVIEDDCAENGIPLPNVTSKILPKVIEYCKKHVDVDAAAKPSNEAGAAAAAASAATGGGGQASAVSEDDLKAWDAEFVKVDQTTLFGLIEMRPFKRVGKTVARKSVAFDPLLQTLGSQLPQTLGSQNQEDVYVQRVHQQPRVHNWTESMDTIFLSLLTEEHTLGNFVNGSFTSVAWVRICAAFNARANLQLSKDQIKNRLKVLKRTYALYNNLANRSGWGWDYNNNTPTPDDPSVWDEVIADNPSYAKCRDRPFPAFKDMAFLTEKTTATGRYAGSSTMSAAQTVESSSSSFPGEDENDLGIRMSGFNLSQSTWDAGSSQSPQYAHFRAPGPPDTPSPTTDIPNVGGSASGSGHSSGSKRPRSPQQTNPQPIPTSSSGGRRRRSDVGHNAIAELVDIGQKKLDLAREIYEHEKSKESRIPTISACMTRVKQMPGITPAKVLVAGQALKDPSDRELFMSFDDEIAIMWLDEQVAMKQNVYYRQYHPGS